MIIDTEQTKKVYEAALRLLTRREHSQRELQQKLQQKGFQSSLIHEIILQLEQDGLQSDKRFAQAYTRQRMERGYGPVRIEVELKERGITDDVLSDVLAKQREKWPSILAKVICKKFSEEAPKSPKESMKRQRFLMYRGFTLEQIRQILHD